MTTANRKTGPVHAILSTTVLIMAMSACTEDHFSRRDTVTAEAGDAIAVNTAQQTRDTMPVSAKHTAFKHDSNRLNKALERYRDPDTQDGGEDGTENGNSDGSKTTQ